MRTMRSFSKPDLNGKIKISKPLIEKDVVDLNYLAFDKKNSSKWLASTKFLISFISISCLSYQANSALSTFTAKTIQGTKPYLSFDNGITKTNSTEELLSISLSNGVSYTASDALATSTSPIALPVGDKFEDVVTFIPDGDSSVGLTDVFSSPNNFAKDDDGDINLSATGTLSIVIKDVNGNSVTLGSAASPCHSPYQLTLSSTAGTLSSRYGDPNNSTFNASTATYYFKDDGTIPSACYAKPSLVYGDNTGTGSYGRPGFAFAGPDSQWDTAKGFKLQNINNPRDNFPNSGFNGAFFDLELVNTTPSQVISDTGSSITNGNITVTLTANGANKIKVSLAGPSASSLPTAAFSGASFKFKSGTTDIYSFNLSKWFIPRSGSVTGTAAAISYCSAIPGYQLALISELTNANKSFASSCTDGTGTSGNGQPIASCIDGNYTRTIGGGVFAEWGFSSGGGTGYYPNSDWEDAVYWTRQAWNSDYQYLVVSNNGAVNHTNLSNANHRATCVSP